MAEKPERVVIVWCDVEARARSLFKEMFPKAADDWCWSDPTSGMYTIPLATKQLIDEVPAGMKLVHANLPPGEMLFIFEPR